MAGATTKAKRPLRHLSATDKVGAIQRIHDGESKASVARDIGVPESTLRGWCKNEEKLRYMTRQSTETTAECDKLSDTSDKDGASGEKRAKYELPPSVGYAPNTFEFKYDVGANLVINSSKSPATCLDLSNDKDTASLPTDFSSFTKAELSKVKTECGTDLSMKPKPIAVPKQDLAHSKSDLSMTAISPLTSLNHLSGMTGLAQSPLGLSFNEIASNLGLLAQYSTMNNVSTSPKSLRAVRPHKIGAPSQLSPKLADKSSNLTENNLAKMQIPAENGLNLVKVRTKHTAPKEPPVDDALWYWLKSQQALMSLTTSQPPSQLPPKIPTTTASMLTVPTVPTAMPIIPEDQKSSWFWQWYKQFNHSMINQNKHNNILFNQLTKGKEEQQQYSLQQQQQQQQNENVQRFNAKEKSESPKNNTKVRAVLDNLLFNNNNNVTSSDEKVLEEAKNGHDRPESPSEAVEHGEKFLKWLEGCSDPSVTAVQVMQFKYLLNNVKTYADRKNIDGGGGEQKVKARRRK